jgi:hypothetical protein
MTILCLTLVLLTGPGGQHIQVNPEAVVSLREARAPDHIHHAVHCNVFTSDGKFIGVEESCGVVAKRLLQAGILD